MRAQVRRELAARLSDWKGLGYGLGKPSEPDLALASVTGLAAFLPERKGELDELVDALEAQLEAGESPAPDLALALASAWRALLDPNLPRWFSPDELKLRLPLALRFAGDIRASDGRDSFGCYLAFELARARMAPPADDWLEDLVVELERFPTDRTLRPYLLGRAADELRIRGSWNEAWALLTRAESTGGVSEQPTDPGLARFLAGARFQLELACGLLDEARLSLQREREAIASGAGDPESRIDLLMNVAGLALTAPHPLLIRQLLAELDAGLADAGLFDGLAGRRANLVARRAIAQQFLEESDPGVKREADERMQAALALSDLDATHRQALLFHRLGAAVGRGDRKIAEASLARLVELNERSPLSQEYGWYLAGWRGRLALDADAPREELLRVDAAVTASFEAFLRSFREIEERNGGVGFLDSRSRRLLLGTRLELRLALEENSDAGRVRAVDAVLPYEALGGLARRLAAPTARLADFVKSIPADAGVLLYLPGYRATHLVCIDPRGVLHRRIEWGYEREPDRLLLERLLSTAPERLTEEALASELEDIQAAFGRLSERLLPQDVRQRVASWKGLYVVGSELLGGVPFEGLSVGSEPLGTSHAVARLPSVAVGARLASRRPPQPTGEGLVLVAAPRMSAAARQRFPRLSEFSFDQDRLLDPIAGSRALVAERATLGLLREELARRSPRALIFVVHGVNDPALESGAGLVLAGDERDSDGILWSDELLSTPFAAPPLVVLAACDAARGTRRVGDDGLWQLGGAMLAQGASCVILSGAPIALEPTLRLLEVFERELALGVAPAEALRRARVALARDAYSHPFYALSLGAVGLGLGSAPVERR